MKTESRETTKSRIKEFLDKRYTKYYLTLSIERRRFKGNFCYVNCFGIFCPKKRGTIGGYDEFQVRLSKNTIRFV